MPGGFGRNSFVGWDLETTWGTPVAAAKYAELVSESIETVRDRKPRPVVRSLHDARESNLYDALFCAKGKFAVELNYVGMLRFFEHLFGDSSDAITNPESGRYQHLFTIQPTIASGKGLSLHINRDVDNGSTPQLRVAGWKIGSAKFTFKPEQNGQVEFDGAGKDASLVAAATFTAPGTTTYCAGHQLAVLFDSVARPVDMIDFTFDNGLDLAKRVVGSKNIAEPIRSDKQISISGTITMDAQQADWSKLDAGTLFQLDVNFTGPTLATDNYRMNFRFLKCLVTANPFVVKGPGVVKATLPFTALFPVSGERLTLTVMNNETVVS